MATTRSCSDLAGKNVVTDFSHGDHLEFDGVFQNFQAVQAASHQVGADTVISLDADHSVTLVGCFGSQPARVRFSPALIMELSGQAAE